MPANQRLRLNHDGLGRGRCLRELGSTAFERFCEAAKESRSKGELVCQLDAALRFCNQALAMLPPCAAEEVALTHAVIGDIYGAAGNVDRALTHFYEAIRGSEASDNRHFAGLVRYDVAISLAKAGRSADAREYALTALRNFETFGASAAADIQKTQSLIAKIEQDLQFKGN